MLNNQPQKQLKLLQTQQLKNNNNNKKTEETGDLIGNKIVNEITKKSPSRNTPDRVESETETPRETYISLEKKGRKLLMV